MVELSIEISEDLKQKMSELSDVDWSRVISAFVRDKVFEWIKLRQIIKKSELTEEDALAIGRKINIGLAKGYKDLVSSK